MTTSSERVRDLIASSGLSQHEFALHIGLDDPKLSKSLGGARRFSSLDLARIAELCQVTVDWLITGAEPELAMAARTTGGSAQAALAAADRFSTIRSDLTELGYPQHLASPPPAATLRGTYAAQGRELAEWALDVLGGGAAADLSGAVEDSFGADVAVVDLGAGFDGLAASSAHVRLILLATSTLPARQRFTLAHELCHLLVADDQGVHLDRDVYDSAQRRDPSEQRANAFASALLMPADTLRAAVGDTGLSDTQFATLACDLLVSPSALAFRLKDLRLIDSGTCDRFRSTSSANAASRAGRADAWSRQMASSGASRLPGLLVRDSYAAYAAGATTLRPYANLLGVDVDQLYASIEGDGEVVAAP